MSAAAAPKQHVAPAPNPPVPSCGVEVNGRLLRARRIEPPVVLTQGLMREIQASFRSNEFAQSHPEWKVYKATETKGGTFELLATGNYTYLAFSRDETQKLVETKGSIPTNAFSCNQDSMKIYDNLYFLSMNKDELPSHHFWAEAASAPTERAQSAADSIDKMAQERERQEVLRLREDRGQQLRRWPDIDNEHPEWLYTWGRLRDELKDFHANKDSGSVFTFLQRLFLKEQIRMLTPSCDDAYLTKMQQEHTEEYTRALGSASFQGTPNNLLTKLTMVHFGLPIAPVTLKNIKNIGRMPDEEYEADEADEVDDNLDTAFRTEKIAYAEKPLEFLNCYDDRSYGYPILRRMRFPSIFTPGS
jgi:hypothetical protein